MPEHASKLNRDYGNLDLRARTSEHVRKARIHVSSAIIIGESKNNQQPEH